MNQVVLAPGPDAALPPARARTSAGARRRRWLPPQHGAWAILGVPFAAGLLPGARWVHLPLLIAWIAGYLASYFALLAVKTGRLRRVRARLLAYGSVALAAGAIVVWQAPRVLWFAPAFAVLAAVNVVFARVGRERSLVNGLASVVQACLMALVVPVAAGFSLAGDASLGGTTWRAFWVCLLYFGGTVPYVKTMIRERGDRGYHIASVTYHAVAAVLATVVSPWFAAPFGWFLVRAVVLPWRRLPIMTVGLIEVANSVVVLGFLAATR
jgi:hypothetical protein